MAENSTPSETASIDWNHVFAELWNYSENVLGALLVLIGGYLLAKILGSWVRRAMVSTDKIHKQTQILTVKIIRGGIYIFTLVAVLAKFGVETTSIIAVLGGMGLAIGLALQGSLSNVASGVLISVIRPFRIGDVIKSKGEVYIIDDIGLFAVSAHQPDGVVVTIPNNGLWGGEIVNLSRTHEGRRRITETFSISYSDDIEKAIAAIKGILESDERYLTDPEPLVAVGNLGQSSVDIIVHAWTQQSDWWMGKLDLTKSIKTTFDDEGISFPFPQREVHIRQVEG